MTSIEGLTPDELSQHIFACLYEGLRHEIAVLREKLADEHVFAFVLYGSTYQEYFACAACTREHLVRHKAEYDKLGIDGFQHVPTTADEWGYIEGSSEAFDTLYKLTDALYDQIYEGEEELCVDDEGFIAIFRDCALRALQQLKDEGQFQGPPFEDDVQLGFQFSDHSNRQNIAFSEKLNSPEWHREVLGNFRELDDD